MTASHVSGRVTQELQKARASLSLGELLCGSANHQWIFKAPHSVSGVRPQDRSNLHLRDEEPSCCDLEGFFSIWTHAGGRPESRAAVALGKRGCLFTSGKISTQRGVNAGLQTGPHSP